jgi:hypothetical protein
MCDDNTINNLSEIATFGYQGEIWKPPLIIVSHMHTTIKHDVLSSCRDHDTALSNFQTSSYNEKKEIDTNTHI